jgi:malonate transporter MadL subunit
MKIYGIAILSLCYLAGQVIGDLLGLGLAFKGNIGGVAFGMLFLIVFADHFKNKGFFDQESESGILFWSSMYIPVVVAMSSIQNVKVAISSGFIAIVVGVLSTLFCFMLIPLISKFSKHEENGN